MLNYLLYQAGWCATVFGAAWGHPWIGTGIALLLMAVHFSLAHPRRSEWTLLLVTGAAGLLVDSLQVITGLLHFPTGSIVPWLCPPWVVVMWMQFGTTFHFSLRWLFDRPRLAALAAAVGGPLAYAAGARIGAVELGEPRALTLLVMGGLWFVVFRVFAGHVRSAPASGYRLS